jgi:hypothetical protein
VVILVSIWIWRSRNQEYDLVPILFRCTSLKPMLMTQTIYTSVRNSIDNSAKNHNRQKAGCTSSMQHALPAFLSILEDLIPHCRTGQYRMLQQCMTSFCMWGLLSIAARGISCHCSYHHHCFLIVTHLPNKTNSSFFLSSSACHCTATIGKTREDSCLRC